MLDASRIFPHRVLSDLVLRVPTLRVSADGEAWQDARARPQVAAQAGTFDLHADEEIANWQVANIAVHVSAPELVVKDLFPPGSDLRGSALLVVSLRCSATKLRRRIRLTPDPDKPAEWYGSLDLRRSDCADVVELIPMLARATDHPDGESAESASFVARYRGALLGFGSTIFLRLGPPKERQGSLKVRWESFSKSTSPWRRANTREMFYVDTTEDNPEVVLNSDHELFRQALMRRRPKGSDAAVKGSLLAYVAHATWMAFFTAALSRAAAVEDDDDVAWPSDEISARTLRRLLPSVLPDFGDELEALRAAVERFRDPARAPALITQMNGAIQSLIRVDDLVVKELEVGLEEAG